MWYLGGDKPSTQVTLGQVLNQPTPTMISFVGGGRSNNVIANELGVTSHDGYSYANRLSDHMLYVVIMRGRGHAMVIKRIRQGLTHLKRHWIEVCAPKIGDIAGKKEVQEVIAQYGLRLYKTLGLNHHATTAETKSAYRRLALKNHPDKCPDATPGDLALMTERMKMINAVYKILQNE